MLQTDTRLTPPQVIPPPPVPDTSGVSASPATSPPVRSVAIVGTEGAGKTVLLTVLANKLADTKNPTYLECLNRQANRFKNENWEALCKPDWPAGSPEGWHFDLQFCLHSEQGATYPLRALDFSGQNFRKLFANEQINQNRDQLPENLRSLADYLQSAHIVIVLVNLTDFMDRPDAATRSDNEWALKFCLDYLKSQRRRVCIALSQADRYRSTIASLGGAVGVVEKYLKEVYNAHIRDDHVQVFCVAAVADTVTLARPGEPVKEVPAPDFSSEGIDDLVNWLTDSASTLEQEELEEQRKADEKRQEEERKRQDEERRRRQWRQIKKALPIFVVIGIILLLWKLSHDGVPPEPPPPPVELVNIDKSPGPIHDDYSAYVRNNLDRVLAVQVRMHYKGAMGGEEQEDKSAYVQPHSVGRFDFWTGPGQSYRSIKVLGYQ
ncbi:MAG: hypothetical protein WCT12_20020 [Verrucomicrobiota bacterium]